MRLITIGAVGSVALGTRDQGFADQRFGASGATRSTGTADARSAIVKARTDVRPCQ